MRQNENDLGNVNKARAEVQGLVLGEILQSLEVGSSGGSSKRASKRVSRGRSERGILEVR